MSDSQQRILAVTDLSAAGDVVLLEAARRAQRHGGRLGVVHAIPAIEAIRPLFPHRLADEAVLVSQLPVRAELALRDRVDTLGLATDYDLLIEQGTMADVALSTAERWQPTLMVVGSPAEGAVGTIGLVRHAAVPVLVARAHRPGRPIVVGTDFSDPSFPAVRAAAAEALLEHAELILAHAVEINPIRLYGVMLPISAGETNDVQFVAQRRLEQVLRENGHVGRPEVYIGPPAAALIQAAATLDAGLLVVGTHGRSGMTRFLLGSVAEAVIHQAPCSVLVAPLG